MRRLLLPFLLLCSLALPAGTAPRGAPPETAAAPASAQEGATEIGAQEGGEEARTLRDWYDMGGWIMHGILLCSVLTVALVLERAWFLRRNAILPPKLLSEIHTRLKRQELLQALELCGRSNASIARVMRAGLLRFDGGLAGMQEAVDTAGAHEAALMRRNLPFLGALANIATMMGLLGTVLGMITSFELIAATGTGDARVVAGGIFQALVTTAAGLLVGIPAIAFHSFLRRKAEVLEADLDELAFRMLEEVAAPRPEPALEHPDAPALAPQEA